jgi:hypothetical protein
MPSKGEHIAKADNNRKFAADLGAASPTRIGWALTALFYAALHYVEAYNAQFNTHFKKHDQMNRDIERNPVLNPIWEDYRDLSEFSWNARYNYVNYGKAELEEAQQCLESVRTLVSGLVT